MLYKRLHPMIYAYSSSTDKKNILIPTLMKIILTISNMVSNVQWQRNMYLYPNNQVKNSISLISNQNYIHGEANGTD